MTNNRISRANSAEREEKSLAEIIESFFNGFRKLWWVAVAFMVAGALLGFHQYKKNYVPIYQTGASFSITAPEDNGTDQSYTNNSQLAGELSVSFDYLINNEVFYEIIKKDIGIDYMPCTITITAVEETNILSILVSGQDAEMNLKVIQSVMDNYSSVAEFVLGDTILTVLEEPVMPSEPVNPYSPLNPIVKFGFIAFILGLIPSILYAMFVKTIKSREDVEELLSVSCLGALPLISKKGREKDNVYCSILDKNVGFRYLEAIRSITSKCEKEMDKNNCQVVLVTSTMAGEGKSTLAMNLAYSLSRSSKKVMLIDGDLRNPTLRKMTQTEQISYSMNQFLNKEIKSSEAIVNIEGTRAIMLAPDKPSPNPVECLNSEAMSSFVEKSKGVVDYVIIDAPSCREVSDAAVLAKYSDGIIYVVKEDYAKVNQIIDTIQEFSYTKVPILGSVLNCTGGRLGQTYGYGYYKSGYNKYGYYKSYGKYGKYGKYGSYGGYGSYGEAEDTEFGNKEQKILERISLTTTDKQKEALEREMKESVGRINRNALEEPEQSEDKKSQGNN